MANTDYTPPGRLGDPNMNVTTDPRTNPKISELLKAMGMSDLLGDFPDPSTWSIESLTPYMAATDSATTQIYEGMDNELPTDADEPEVETSTETIKGVDDNDIILYICRPKSAQGPLPAVIYSHGGGMVNIATDNKAHRRWIRSLALQGLVVIMTDFRNAYTASGYHPFPAGLNDCAAAVQHVAANRSELGISTITLQGESGGGNLAITTALKAKREGWLDAIAGVYATVPYISGGYGWPDSRKMKELPSLIENDGYLLSMKSTAASAWYYGPKEIENENAHAWPYHSAIEDLKGLPPFVIEMNELDPLRDEGMVFYRKLAAAGVKVEAKVSLGVTHGAALVFRKCVPEVHEAAIRDVAGFAKSLGGSGVGGEKGRL
jgi:acetyl esterase/lipase